MQTGFKSIILGVILMAAFGLVLGVVIPLGVQVPSSIKVAALAPDFWPRIVTVGIIVLGAVLTAGGVVRFRRHGASAATPPDAEEVRARRVAAAKITAAMALLLAYYALVPWLGIVVASIVALPAFAALYGERRWTVLVPLSVALPVAMYYFFTRVASIPMPLGIFE